MTRGLFTPPAFSPKSSTARNQAAMSKVLGLVAVAVLLYDKAVWRARNLQVRHIVDALYARYERQLSNGSTLLSFGEWLAVKKTLPNTYAKMGAEAVLWVFEGIVKDVFTDRRFRLFNEQEVPHDWFAPLLETFINHRVEEDFRIRVIMTKVALTGFREALYSLEFKKQLILGRSAN